MGRLLSLLRREPRSLVGVDIGVTRVKLLELDRAGDGYRVLAYASEAMPQQAVNNFQIIDPKAVARTILRALERSGSRTRDAVIAVSGPSVFSKTILMPAGLDDTDLEQQIMFDAEHHIPHPIEEVNLDFQVLGADADNPRFNRVLLVACRRDDIEMRTAALEMAHMRVRVVDVEEYALRNACRLLSGQLPALGIDHNLAVFDVGPENTRLTIQREGQSLYTREFRFGGSKLTHQLIQHHELSDFDVLRAKIYSGELGAQDIAADLRVFAESLAIQIDRMLSFYQSAAAGSDESIDHVVIAGDPTLLPGLEDALTPFLPWSFTLGNPLDGMLASTAARRNHVGTDAPTLMVAAGLALRGVA